MVMVARKADFFIQIDVLQPMRNHRYVYYNYKEIILYPLKISHDEGRVNKMTQETLQKDNARDIHPLASNPKVQSNQRETAQYIADMVLELRNMAKAVELRTLQGLLEVTFYEAFSAANQVVIPEGEIEKLRGLSKASNG